MKILQVVNYINPDGAYGGPVRVAFNQAKALTQLGHEVTIAAAAGGYGSHLPQTYDGFPVELFKAKKLIPRSGFAGLASPQMLLWLRQAVRRADVTHVHMSRDLVTMPAAAVSIHAQTPVVVQTHGMIDRSDKILAAPLDRFLTVPVLQKAHVALHLTNNEKIDLTEVGGPDVHMTALPNGVHVPAVPAVEQQHGPNADPEVVCLARIHRIKRPLYFVRAGQALVKEYPNAQFTLIGPDEGEGPAVSAAIKAEKHCGVTWSGPVPPEKTTDRMRQASIFVLPSESEQFSMSTLEAMALGLPVVITETSGLASLVRDANAGIVCGMSQTDLNGAVTQLLKNPSMRHTMGANGRKAVKEDYSMTAIGERLVNLYMKSARNEFIE